MKYQQYSPGRSEVRRWNKQIRENRCGAVVRDRLRTNIVFFWKKAATSEILDELEKLLVQGAMDDLFISTNVNTSSLKFVIDRLADRGVNGQNNWKDS